jgi:hypothetical protein
MRFVEFLLEASGIPLEQVIPAMKKDSRVKQVFQRDLQPDDIQDKRQFLDTVKFYFLNNQSAVKFAEASNSDFKNTFKFRRRQFKDLSELTAFGLKQLKDLLTDFRKELDKSDKPKLNAALTDALYLAINGWKYGNLVLFSKELFTYPTFRPVKPVKLYRGIKFDGRHMKETPSEDGSKVAEGSGLKFIRSIRKGSRTIDLEWDRISAWTSSLETATKYATPSDAAPVSSNQLGFVISTIAQPEVIILQSDLIPIEALKKDIFILKGGKRLCRVVKRFSHKGEEDPIDRSTADSEADLAGLQEMFGLLNRVLKVPYDVPSTDIALTKPEDFRTLIQPEAAEKITKLLDIVISIYNEHLSSIDDAYLLSGAGGELGKVATAAAKLKSMLEASSSFEKGSPKLHELSGKELLQLEKFQHASGLILAIAGTKRWTDYRTTLGISKLGMLLNFAPPANLHLRSFAKQREYTDKILRDYEKAMGEKLPADRKELAAKMVSDANTFTQAAGGVLFLNNVKLFLQLASSED